MKWIKIKDKGIEITKKQQFNGLTYPEILKKVKEEIADYPLLQIPKNLLKTCIFLCFLIPVPNPNKISKKNNYVAWFLAGSVRAILNCGRYPGDSYSSLGVFLTRKLKEKGK